MAVSLMLSGMFSSIASSLLLERCDTSGCARPYPESYQSCHVCMGPLSHAVVYLVDLVLVGSLGLNRCRVLITSGKERKAFPSVTLFVSSNKMANSWLPKPGTTPCRPLAPNC